MRAAPATVASVGLHAMAVNPADVAVVLVAAAAGGLIGPVLAALSQTVPADGPLLTRGTVRGVPARRRRIAAVTAGAAATFAVLAAAIGATAALPAYLFVGAAGVLLAVIDAEHHRLPDRIVLPSYVVGATLLLLAALVSGDVAAWVRALLAAGAVFAALFVLALISPDGFGFGDVKLGGLLGLYLGWLGWDEVVLGVAAGFVIGTVVALALVVVRRASMRSPVAFGPALLAGALVAVAAGTDLFSVHGG